MIYLCVAMGGGIGALLRYIMVNYITHLFGSSVPYGTLCVNIFGSFLIGLTVEYLSKNVPQSDELRVFLVVGVLGGFTTFSAFSLEVLNLYQRGEMLIALAYILSSVIVSVLSVYVAIACIRWMG